MSTLIGEIKRPNLDTVLLMSFYGGKKRGLCINVGTEEKSFEFTKQQAQQLVKELQNWLGETELPFNEQICTMDHL